MFDVGGGELLLILFAALLLFGPKKIPEIAQMVGKGMQQVRKAQAQLQSQISELQTEIKTVVEEPIGSISKSSPTIDIENPSKEQNTSQDIENLYRQNNGQTDIVEVPKRIFPDEVKPSDTSGTKSVEDEPKPSSEKDTQNV